LPHVAIVTLTATVHAKGSESRIDLTLLRAKGGEKVKEARWGAGFDLHVPMPFHFLACITRQVVSKLEVMKDDRFPFTSHLSAYSKVCAGLGRSWRHSFCLLETPNPAIFREIF